MQQIDFYGTISNRSPSSQTYPKTPLCLPEIYNFNTNQITLSIFPPRPIHRFPSLLPLRTIYPVSIATTCLAFLFILLLAPLRIFPIAKPTPLLHPRHRRKYHCSKYTQKRRNQSPKANNLCSSRPEELDEFCGLIEIFLVFYKVFGLGC